MIGQAGDVEPCLPPNCSESPQGDIEAGQQSNCHCKIILASPFRKRKSMPSEERRCRCQHQDSERVANDAGCVASPRFGVLRTTQPGHPNPTSVLHKSCHITPKCPRTWRVTQDKAYARCNRWRDSVGSMSPAASACCDVAWKRRQTVGAMLCCANVP